MSTETIETPALFAVGDLVEIKHTGQQHGHGDYGRVVGKETDHYGQARVLVRKFLRAEREPVSVLALSLTRWTPMRPGGFAAHCMKTRINEDGGRREPKQCPIVTWDKATLPDYVEHMTTVHGFRMPTAKAIKPPKFGKRRAVAQKPYDPKPGDPGTTVTFDGGRTGTVWAITTGGSWVIPDEPAGIERLVLVAKDGYIRRTWTDRAARMFAHRFNRITALGTVATIVEDKIAGNSTLVHVPGCEQIEGAELVGKWSKPGLRAVLASLIGSQGPALCPECLGDPAEAGAAA